MRSFPTRREKLQKRYIISAARELDFRRDKAQYLNEVVTESAMALPGANDEEIYVIEGTIAEKFGPSVLPTLSF